MATTTVRNQFPSERNTVQFCAPSQGNEQSIEELLKLLEVQEDVRKIVPIAQQHRANKTKKVCAAHLKFCGKTHKWMDCPYNPQRNKPGLLCPVCGRMTQSLRDYGRCKHCLYGKPFSQGKSYETSFWEAQGPTLDGDQPGLTSKSIPGGRRYEYQGIILDTTYCHECAVVLFSHNDFTCPECECGLFGVDTYSRKRNWLHCPCFSSNICLPREFLPKDAEFADYHEHDKWTPQGPEELDAMRRSYNPFSRLKAKAIDSTQPLIDYAKQNVESVVGSVESVTGEFKQLGSKANRIVDDLTQFIMSFPDKIPGSESILSAAAGLLGVITVFKSTESLPARLASVGLFLSRYIKVSEVLEWALNKVSEMLPNLVFMLDYFAGKLTKGWTTQGTSDQLLAVSAGLVSVLVGIFLKKIPAKQDFDSVLRRVDLFPKAIRGASDMYGYVTALLKTAVEETCSALGIKNPLKSGFPEEVDVWVKEAQDILTTKMSESTYTSAYADRVMNCYVQGTVVVKNLNMTRADAALIRYVSTVLSSITSLNSKLAHLGFISGPRAEPLMVYLHGTSGKGKSGLTVPFFIELAKHDKDLDAANWQKLIYMRCAENEYWDGARNDQPFLCYDDFGQQRDSAANPNVELFEIIRLANIVPYPAHMASLEEKGKTFLHPKCVLLTSNSRKPKIESLTFPEAFFRRMDITAEVDIKDEFCYEKTVPNGTPIRTLDVTKCAAAFDPRVYEFSIEGIDKKLDYREFMALIAEKYDAKMKRGSQVLKELHNFTQHSTSDIYDAIANGTFDNMVQQSVVGTPWACQNSEMEIDPFIPHSGKDLKQIVSEIDSVTCDWFAGIASPQEKLLDEVMALHRQLVAVDYDVSESSIYNKYVELCERAEFEISAALPSFTDGIVVENVVLDMYKLFLFKKLPAQLWPEKSNDDDLKILEYFNAQQNVAYNEIIWSPDLFNGKFWDSQKSVFRNLTEFSTYNEFLTALNKKMRFLSPASTALGLYHLNASCKDGARFKLPAVARAYKCMYYGKFMKDLKIDDQIVDVIDLYIEKGAGVFMERMRKVNKKAAVRIARLFVQVSDKCSRNGCPIELSVCYERALLKAVRQGVILRHELDEMNQTPIYMEEKVKEISPEIHGETTWEKIKETYFKIHQRVMVTLGNKYLQFAYMILTAQAVAKILQFVISAIYMAIKTSYGYLRSFFVKSDKIETEGPITEFKIAAYGWYPTKIRREDCKLCQDGQLFPEGIKELAKWYLTRRGFVSRFEYWSLRRMAFEPHRFSLVDFKRAAKLIDAKVGQGFTHACLHGDLDETPLFKADTFDNEEIREYEKDYYNRWHAYLATESQAEREIRQRRMNMESFSTKEQSAQRMKVESFNEKETRVQKLCVESFNEKEARIQRMKVEGSYDEVLEREINKLQKFVDLLREEEYPENLLKTLEDRLAELRRNNFRAEGNPSAEAYFEAMKTIYADAKIMPEGMIDANAWDIISKKLWSNQAIMTTPEGAEICKGVFVRGNCFLTYKHWRPTCKSDMVEMRFLDGRPYFKFSLKESRIIDHQNRNGEIQDICMIELPRYCPAYPDITKYFISQDALSKVNGRTAQLCGISELPNGGSVSYSLQNLKVQPLDCAEYDDSVGGNYICRSGYTYEAETKKGDCGSVLILRDNAFDKKIIGIHTAGQPGKGFSTSVYYERIMDMLKSASWESQCAPPTDLITSVDVDTPVGAFFPIGKLPFAVGSVSGTTLRPTAIAGSCIETFTKPAFLRPVLIEKDGERIMWDPLMKGLEKCGTILEPLPTETMEIVSHDVARVYINATKADRERRIYTIREAVFGIEGDEYFKSLTASTSPGFPWGLVKEPRMAGKRTWMDLDTGELNNDLIYHVEKRIEFALVGRRYPTLWMDLLKDERRPIEKVNQGKTRVFSGSPIDFTIACRMYFGAFVAAQAEGRIENESLVGTNCYAFDWNLLSKRMLKFGDNVIAGDYSNWDGSVSAQLLFAAVDVINTWYGNDEEGNKVRTILMMDIAYSLHVIGNSVYMWTHSMPSGVYLTATVNTIIGQMLMRLFFMRAVPKQLANMGEFEKNVRIAIYGDDNTVGVSDYIKKWFNQQTITEAATSMGMTYTDEQKTGKEVPPTRSLKDVTLLKRHFEYSNDEGRWVGPLQLRTVLDIPNWYRRDNPQEVVLPLIVECTLRELALHPKAVYYEYRNKIETALAAAHMRVPAMPDYESLRYSMLNGYRTVTGGYVNV